MSVLVLTALVLIGLAGVSAAPAGAATAVPKVTLTVPPEAAAGSQVTATGTLTNPPANAQVAIQDKPGSTWLKLVRGTVAAGKYSVSFTMPSGVSPLPVRAVLRDATKAVAYSGAKYIVAAPPPAPNAYWGGWIGSQYTGSEAPWDTSAITAFEAATGKAPSLIEFAAPFAECSGSTCNYDSFPTTPFNSIRSRGAIPFFSWSSQSTPASLNEPNFQLADVIEGRYDAYIRQFATAAKAWGHPFFLRFDWEMNGTWFPWSERTNGNAPGQFVAAWRHVHDIFTSVGATNVSWVWCPYVNPNATLQPLETLYPGDEYVDWTGLDGYNWGPSASPPRKWRSFSYLFGPTYREITERIAPAKPILVGETASAESGGSKAEWIGQMFTALPTEFSRLQGLIWFDKEEAAMQWPLASSPAAQQAFAAGIANPRYLGNAFGALASGPIPAP